MGWLAALFFGAAIAQRPHCTKEQRTQVVDELFAFAKEKAEADVQAALHAAVKSKAPDGAGDRDEPLSGPHRENE